MKCFFKKEMKKRDYDVQMPNKSCFGKGELPSGEAPERVAQAWALPGRPLLLCAGGSQSGSTDFLMMTWWFEVTLRETYLTERNEKLFIGLWLGLHFSSAEGVSSLGIFASEVKVLSSVPDLRNVAFCVSPSPLPQSGTFSRSVLHADELVLGFNASVRWKLGSYSEEEERVSSV